MEHFACCDAFHLQNHLRFLNHVLNGVEESEISTLEFKWKNIVSKSEEYFMGVVSEQEEDDIEENLVAYVKNGKVEEVEAYFNKVFFSTDNLMMKEMQNINLQRSLICGTNMLNSRVAIQDGTDKQMTKNLAGYYLELISRADSSTDLSHLFYKMILDYTKRVKSVQEFQSDSMVAKRINSYIQSHLYEKMSTAIIAKALHMDEAYLSEEFRKSTGQTVTRYIQECKIREAAFLLERGYSPAEISNMLEFSSPSYFGVVFKKIMGITPMEYKRTME